MVTVQESSRRSAEASCPFSHLPVRMWPEWTDVLLEGDYRMSLRLIGEQILYSSPCGSVDEKTVDITLSRIEEFARTTIDENLSFVWVSDYSGMTGITMSGRKAFVSTITRWPRLRGMILFGLSPFLAAAARVAVRLRLVGFPVFIVDSYGEAIDRALEILRSLPSGERPELAPAVVVSDPAWVLETEGYSIRYEVIDGRILHSVQKGRVREDLLDAVFELRDDVMRMSGLKGKAFSILSGIGGIEGSEHAARLGYVRRMSQWYRENPFNVEVFYGVNAMMKTAITVTAPLAPFKVHVTNTFEDGLEYIAGFSAGIGDRAPMVPLPKGKDVHFVSSEEIEELVKVLGAIGWDTDDPVLPEGTDVSGPFEMVYEAVRLIRNEIGDLLDRQRRDAEERRRLEVRLARAEKMEALGLLAGGVAHDLNNILSGIVSYPELLLMDVHLDPKVRKGLEVIKNSGEQAAAVVHDLMAVSRGAASRMEVLSLGGIVREYLDSADFLELTSRFPLVSIDAVLEDEGGFVYGSPPNLRTVVANLVVNAVESFMTAPEMLRASATVLVETEIREFFEARRGIVEEIPPGRYVVLRVSDSGPGINEIHQSRVFEPFFSKKIMGRSGTGLGLTVVWNVVKNHGGAIDLRSGTGGTTFEIYLPLTGRAPRDRELSRSFETLRGRGEKILVVDDVALQREVAVEILEHLGYRADAVASGEEAVERIRAGEEFDLVVLDMLMEPGLNGRRTLEAILELKPGQEAVVTSGYSQDDEVRRALKLGAGSFVAKPYSVERLGRAVRDALRCRKG